VAVAKTGALFKALTFDGYSSRNYGIYITGEAVYNAPERDVEMVTIPGRNGAFALDHERFENIEVTYPAGIFADNEEDFADGISSFRNMLCSRQGYCVLQDEYHPDEYRLAVYKSGLEVTSTQLKAGEFDITFTCKPQRFLTTGDTAVAVANNGTITNPTLFDAKPQLQVKGYGDITLGGGMISIQNIPLGNIQVADEGGGYNSTTQSLYNTTNINNGDLITCNRLPEVEVIISAAVNTDTFSNLNILSVTNATASANLQNPRYGYVILCPDGFAFSYNTSASYTASCTYNLTINGTSYTGSVSFVIAYSGTTFTYTATATAVGSSVIGSKTIRYYGLYCDSTKQVSGNPLYIDLDIGEAWNEDSGTPVSMDNVVTLPAQLPTLASGSNTITYDNTITSFKVVPRWWRI